MKKLTKLMLTLTLLVLGVGANALNYETLGGKSQNGWSWGQTLTSPNTGTVGYKLTSQYASVGLMGGYSEIDVTVYNHWKVTFAEAAPSTVQISYSSFASS